MHIFQNCSGKLAAVYLIWLMLFFSLPAAATPPLIQLNEAGNISVGTQFLLFTDTRNKESIETIFQKEEEGAWAIPESGKLNTGYSASTFWMKLRIANLTAQGDWHFVAESPHMQIKAWREKPNEPGALIPQDAAVGQFQSLPLNLAPGEESIYFVRMQTNYVADLHFTIVRNDQLRQRDHQQTVFVSLIAGCFLSMIVYNFFLFVTLRDPNYLYYLIFALVNSHMNLLAVDFPQNIDTWLGWDWWAITPFYVPMAPLVTFIFARSFLQTRAQNPRLDKALLVYMGGLLVFVCAALVTPRASYMNALQFYMLVGVFLLLAAGFQSLAQGYRPARFFLAGIGTFLLGILLLLLKSIGFLPSTFFTINGHLMAQAAEMLLMSLALGNRIKLLEDAKTRAEVTVQVKSRLLRIISHDIVTPLTVVKATAYQLRKEVSDPLRVERVVRAASIIEDIVGFIRKKEMMESGEIMELGPVGLKEIFDEQAFLFQDRALEKNITLTFELEHPDLAVQAEPVSLSNEVLGNLISNAIKFSFAHSQVIIRGSRANDGRVVISIEDQGIGMDQTTLSSLFDASVKQSRMGTQGEKGIGFGMPLAKAYVDAYGGRIEAQSRTAGQSTGTTLRIILQAAESTP